MRTPSPRLERELLRVVRRFIELVPPDLFTVRPIADLEPAWTKPAPEGFAASTAVSTASFSNETVFKRAE
jgi:hypothetical protein